jgi:signal transduction histidine kinase
MRPRPAARLAWALWVLTAVLAAADAVLALLNRPAWDFDVYGVPGEGAVLGLATATIGLVVASRLPRNPVGWLLCALGPGIVMAWLPKDYAVHTLLVAPGSLPGGAVAAWLGAWAWVLGVLPFPFLVALFPDGRLPSPRWRPLAWATGVAWVLVSLSLAMAQWPIGTGNLSNFVSPTNTVRGPWLSVFRAVFPLVVVTGIALVAAVLVRFRGATGDLRQQLKWFVFAASILVAATLVTDVSVIVRPGLITGTGLKVIGAGLGLAFVAVMAAIGLAILKYRLYDIDVVINRTVVYAALAGFITAVYVAIVVGMGSAIGAGGEPNVALSIVATAVVAIAFQPVRERVQRLANRVVYGKRATPYEVMSDFAHRMSGALSIEDVLPRMAQTAAQGLAASSARVAVFLPGGDDRSVTWPAEAGNERFGRAVPVTHRGEVVGELAVAKPPGEPLRPGEERLLANLAAQAGLALHNVRLTEELRARFDQISRQTAELQASRQRIVTARDEERRRLDKEIREGAAAQLRAVEEGLERADGLMAKSPERTAHLLESLGSQATRILEELRELARGIFPPLLADQGLAAALEAQFRKARVPVSLDADSLGRLPPEVEAGVYFCVVEALANAARHAAASRVLVRLRQADAEIVFEVTDDGRGFDPESAPRSGLQTMADRIEALGGTFDVRSSTSTGTTITGRVPVSRETASSTAGAAS